MLEILAWYRIKLILSGIWQGLYSQEWTLRKHVSNEIERP